MADLLERQLADNAAFKLVDRANFNVVITNQMLSEALTAGGVQGRVRLGHLVKADLLVFLREQHGQSWPNPSMSNSMQSKPGDTTCIELTVAETRSGIRLLVEPAIWIPTQVEQIVHAFAAAVDRARLVSDLDKRRLFAVPPFESKDFGFEKQHLQAGFARLAENLLMRQPHVLVVELAEARALAREIEVGGNSIVRELPLYVLGSYKSSRGRDGPCIDLALELRRGNSIIGRQTRQAVPQADCGPAVQTMLAALLATPGTNPAPMDLVLETRILVGRADLFKRLGEWERAIGLYESALLCSPLDREAHVQMLEVYLRLMTYGGVKPVAWQRSIGEPLGRMQAAEAFVEHLGVLLEHYPFTDDIDRPMRFFVGLFELNRIQHNQNLETAELLYHRTWRRFDEIILRSICVQGRAKPIEDEVAYTLAGLAAYNMNRLCTAYPAQALDRTRQFVIGLSCREGAQILKAQLYTLQVLGRNLKTDGAAYLALLAECEKDPSPKLEFAAQVARIIYAMRTSADGVEAKEQVRRIPATEDWYKVATEEIDQHAERLKKTGNPTREARYTGNANGFMLPSARLLRDLSDGHPRSHPFVSDWKMLEGGTEMIAAGEVLYTVGPSGTFTRLEAASPTGLCWDGQYVWVTCESGVALFTPQGEHLATYNGSIEHPIEHGGFFQLQLLAHGRVCLLGFIDAHPLGARNWMSIIHYDPATRRFNEEVFFETRGQTWNENDHGLEAGFLPGWVVRLPRSSTDHPIFIADRRGNLYPWVIDPSARKVSVSGLAWGPPGKAAADSDAIYFCPGRTWRHTERKFVLGRISNIEQAPESVLSPDRDASAVKVLDGYQYDPMHPVLFEGRWHILYVQPGDTHFVWIAVDPKMKTAYILANEMSSPLLLPRLFASEQYGLVLVASGHTVYSVTLPPVQTWPVFTEKAFGAEAVPVDQLPRATTTTNKPE